MPGVSTPPEAPERIVSSVMTPLTAQDTSSTPISAQSQSPPNPICAVARPLPITCGTQMATTPVITPASGSCQSIALPVAWCRSAQDEPNRNTAPATPHTRPATSANPIRSGVNSPLGSPMS